MLTFGENVNIPGKMLTLTLTLTKCGYRSFTTSAPKIFNEIIANLVFGHKIRCGVLEKTEHQNHGKEE